MLPSQALDREAGNPLDKVERLALTRDWTFDRTTAHEVTMLVASAWSDLHVSTSWREDVETLHVACTFDARVPAARQDEAARLVARINGQQLHGHFDLWPSDGSIVFRNTLLLSGGAEANEAQCEALIRLAVEACQRYFPAVQFVVWAGRTAEEALASSLFETMGGSVSIDLKGSLVLVGAGKMGGAMLEGWLKSGVEAARIAVLEPAPSSEIRGLLTRHGIRLNPVIAEIGDPEVLVVAVKPQVMDEVLSGLASLVAAKPLVISVAAGKRIASFERHFGKDAAVIRTIPNTPAAIGRGITAMAANPNVGEAQLRLARTLLEAIGEVVKVADEAMIDAVTALSGSGPAYVFYVTECLAAAGEKVGLPPDLAMQLARATVAGAGELMRVSGEAAAVLRRNVTSPQGTTHAALQVLMAGDGLQPVFNRAVAAAAERSRQLAS